MAQLKETKIYGGLDVYDSYENKNNIINVNSVGKEINLYPTYINIKSNPKNEYPFIGVGFKTASETPADCENLFICTSKARSENNDLPFITLAALDDSGSNIYSLINIYTNLTEISTEDFKITSNNIEVSDFDNIYMLDENQDKTLLSDYIISTMRNNVYSESVGDGSAFLYLTGVPGSSTSKSKLYKNVSLRYNIGEQTLYTPKLSAISVFATSDKRLKENIKKSTLNFTSLINKLNIKEYNFKNDEKKQKNVGIIAQDLLKILPDDLKGFYLSQNSEGFYSVNDSKFVYILAGAFQEEHKKRLELEARLDKIEKLLSER